MKRSLLLVCLLFSFFNQGRSQSACSTCTVSTSIYTANLSANPNSTYTVSSKRTNFCCQATGSDNCVRFEVTVHPQAAQISFLVSSGNNGTWQINCTGTAYTPGQKPCLGSIGTSFCITYCNPGNNTDTYTITTSSGLSTGADLQLRENCLGKLTVGGLNESSITWTSVFPGAVGTYTNYLSCTAACDTTNVTPGVGAPAYIDYRVCGTATGCSVGTYCDTQRVYVSPALSVAITPTAPVICSGTAVTLTATPTGGTSPFSYTWSPGGATTSTVSASSAGVYTVQVNDGASGTCGSITQTVTVTSSTTPTITSANTATICSGGTVNLPFTANVPSTYTWIAADNTNTTGESLTTQSTATLNNAITNNTVTAQNVIYTVSPTSSGGCPGANQTVTVTVNPTPGGTVTPSSQSICSGGASNLALSSNVTGTTYSWTVTQTNITGASSSSGTVIAQTLNTTTTSAGTAVYTITPTVGSCPGSNMTATVTVNPIPSMTATPSSQALCSGGATSIALTSDVGSTTFNWTVSQSGVSGASNSSGATITQTLTATGSSPGTATYTITPTAGGCSGTAVVVTVTVNPIPSATATPSSQSICSLNTTTVALTSNVSGTTFNWTVTQTNVTGASASSGATIAQTLTATTSSAGTAVYTITPTANGCAGSPVTATVTINPAPSVTATPGSQTICSGNASGIVLTSTTGGATFAWTVTQTNVSGASASSGTVIAQTLSATSTSAGTAVYTITPTAGGCAGSPITATVTVNPIPSATATPNAQTICSLNTSTVALTSNVGGTTFNWTVTQTNVTGASASSGASIAQTLTATSTSAGTAVYTITPTAGGCNGSAITATVTVNPIPSATATPNSQSICSLNTTTVALTSNVGGTTFNWTVTQTNVTGASAGSSATIAQTLTATTASAGTAVYTITPTAGGCPGSAITATVTVNPAPSVTATPSSQTLCSGNATSIALSSSTGGATFSWTVAQSGVSGASNGSGATIAQTLSATGAAAGTATYTITAVSGGCSGAPIVVTVTVNPIPSATATPSSQSICSLQSTTVALSSNVGGTTFNWTVTQTNVTGASAGSGATIAQTLTATTASTGTAVYTITPTAGGCAGSAITATVTVNPAPSVTATPSSQTLCSGNASNIVLTSSTGGATFAWTVTQTNVTGASASSGTVIAQTLSASTTSAGTAVYTITPSAGGCAGAPITATVTVNPIPSATATPNAQTICSLNSSTVALTSNVSGTTFNWIVTQTNITGASAGSGATIAQTLTATSTSSGTAVYTITPTAGGCNGSAITVTVTVNPIPTATATPNSQSICSLNTTTVALTSNVGGTIFNWTVTQTNVTGASASSGATIAQTLTATTASAGTAVYTITPTAGGCAGSPITATVTVNPAPSVTATPTSQSICSGGTTSIALTSGTGGTTFAWTVAQSGVSGASNSSGANIAQTLSATGTSPGTATYTITPTAAGCSGAPIVVTVTVNPIPSATATPSSQSICSLTTPTIALTSGVSGTTFNWTVTQTNITGASAGSGATIAQTLTATTASAGTAVYTITPTANSCPGSAITATVTVNPAPSITATPSSQNLCSGNATSIALTSSTGGATFAWTVTQTGVSGASNSSGANITQTLTATGASPGTAVYTITPSAAGCSGAPIVVTVTVNPIPSATATPTSQSICSLQTTTVALTSSVSGTTFNWTVTQTNVTGASASSGATIAQTLTATTASPGTAVYTITPSVGGCTGSPVTVTITVNPAPSVTATPNAQTICSGNATNIALTSTTGGATFAWTVTQTNVTGASASSGAIIAQTLNASTSSAGTAVYTITPSAGGCAGAPITATVTVNPIPSATATPNAQTLCSGSATSISLTSNVGGTAFTWTVSQSGTSGASNGSGSTITQTLTTTGSSSGTATYTITPTAGGCAGSTLTVPVTVNPIPSVTATPNAQTFCSGGTSSIALTSNVAGATFAWTVTQTGVSGASASSGSSIAQTISTTGAAQGTAVYTITPSASGCNGSPVTATVTVNPIPVMTSVSSATICSGQTVSIPLTSNVASTYTWIAASNPNTTGESVTTQTTSTLSNTLSGTTGNSEVVVYTVTPTSTGGSCVGSSQTVSVTVSPTPILTITPTAQTLCSGNATSIALSSNVSGTTYTWTVSQSGVSGASAGSGSAITQTLITTGATSGTAIYTVAPVIGSCTGAALTATVTVNPIPSATATPSSQTICSGGASSIALTSNVSGTTFAWTVSQSGVSGAANGAGSSITQTLSATGSTQGTAVYTITPTANSCSGTPIVVTVSVNPLPSVTATPATQAVCSGNAASIALSSNVTGTTFTWTVSQAGASGASAGSGSTITHTLTATGASPGTVTYTITSTAAGCGGTAVVATVTVNPIPLAPSASSNSPVCLNGTINLTSGPVTGATYSWNGPNGFTSSSQNPSISNASAAEAGTYSVNVTVNGCTGPNQTVTVVVNTPPPSSLTPGSNSPVCTNQTLSLTISPITNANYIWTGPNTFTSSVQNPTIPGVTVAAAGVYTLNVTVPGCVAGGSGTVSVIVNPTPNAPNASNNGPLCAGDSLMLNAVGTGTSYNWSGPSGFTNTNQNTGIGNSTTTNAGTYSVTTTANGCTSAAGLTTVVINAIPATPTVTSNSPLCVGATLNLSTSAVSGATYSWTGPNSFTASTQNPTRPGLTTSDAGTYSLTVTVNGCTSASGTVAVAVNSAAAAPVAGSNSPVCVGDTLFLTATSIGGATYSWTGPNSFSSTQQNPFITPVSLAANGNYTVIANNGCASTPAAVSVTVNPTPSVPGAGNNSPVCEGGTITFTASPVGSATYNWTGPNSFTASTQNTSVSNVTAADAGTYSVTVTVGGCTSAPGVTTATVNVPAITTVSGSQTVCANSAAAAISATVTGGSTTGTWSSTGTGTFSPSATALSATYTPSNADTAAGSVTLTLTSTNNGACAASVSSLTVTITDAPGVNAGANQSVCANNAAINLNGSVSGGAGGGTWTTAGTGTFTPNANTLNATYSPSAADISAGTVSFTLTTTGVGQCNPASSVMTATITTAPTVNAGPDQVKCKSSLNATLNGTVTVTNSGTWTSTGTGTFTPNANSLNATYTPSTTDTSAGSVLLILTSTNNGGCTPVSDTLMITYTDIPVVNAGPDQTVCANNINIVLSGSVTVGGSTGTWSTSGTGTFTPNNTTLNATYLPSNADTAAGIVTFTLTSTGGCVVVTDNMTVTITDAPGANAGVNQAVCANNPNTSINGVITGATNTGIWSTTGTGTFTPSNTSLSATYVPSAADISSGQVFLVLTSTGNGNCNAAVDSMRLLFTTPPTAFAGNDSSFCANSSYTFNGSITGGGGTGTWTTSGSGTFTPSANALNATYTPSAADTATGTITFTLTSTNNGGCISATDQVVLTITDGPSINAGIDQAVCTNNNVVTLNGSVTISTGVLWSTTGDGIFGSNTSSSTTYTPGTNDISSGSATIVITSTGNGGCIGVTDTMKVTIEAAPVVNAGIDLFVCSGTNSANVSGTVSGVSSTGTWTTLGSGTFTSPNNLNTTYNLSPADTLAGSVTLVLTSTANGSCNPATDTVKITITPAGFASAGNDTTICASVASVQLGGIITGGTGAGQWSTSGTGTFTPNNTTLTASYAPSAADITAGSVTIKLTPVNSCNPTADSLVLTIQPLPVPNAGIDQFICASTNIVVLNGSVSGGASTGIWSTLGSGTFSPTNTTLNATYALSTADSTAGTVTLVLTSTNNGNCAAVTDTVKITLTSTANALAGNDTTICSNIDSVNLAGVINGGTGQGQWSSSGTGTFSPNNTTLNAWYVPSTADSLAGNVVLTLTPINACSPTADSLVLTLAPAPAVNAGIDQFICISTNTVSLNGSVTGGTTTGDWSTLGSGNFTPSVSTLNAVYTLSTADSTAGSVTLVLTSTNNGVCGAASDTMQLFTTTSTSAVAGNDTSICSNDSLALNGSIIGGSAGTWSTSGSGNFNPNNTTLNATYLPSAADITNGSVTLVLTPANGCQPQIDSLVLTFNTAPVVSAGSSTVICASTNTVGLNGSVSGGSSTGIWATSGTGTFAPNDSTLNGTYVLSTADSAAGSVTLILTSTNNGSCGAVKDSITVTITNPAIAQGGSDFTVCANNAGVALSGTVTGGSGQGQWTSNGSGSFTPADTILNATYVPSSADIANGSVVITLTPLNSCAPQGDSLVLTITPAPTVNAGNDTTFCGATNPITLGGSINSVSTGAVWTSNGTGGFSPNDSTLNATYTPVVTDNDTLVFVLTSSGNGLCNAVSDTVVIIRNAKPIADFVFSNLCMGQAVAFTDSSKGVITGWAWDFGGGNTSAQQNPSFSYPASGTYTVSLHTSGGVGCDDSISKTITIQAAPVASFSVSNLCFGDSVNFTDGSSVTPGSINSWSWSFGDGNSSTMQNPVHMYDSVKVYTVSLVVLSDSGCSSTATQTVEIHNSPVAGFSTASNCGSLLVNFSDTSAVIGADSLTAWTWTFGDGNTSALPNPSNTYSATGTYTVLLQVETSGGCTDTASAVINLGSNVTADYIPAGGSYNTGQGINFTNQSVNGTNYSWNFGDNTTSTATDPSHAFSQPGTYTVMLVAGNSLGCTDSVAYVFEINTQGVTAPTGFTPDGDGLNDYFYIMGGPFNSYELHIFNEWGNEIFLSNSQADKWDGTFKGVKQAAGTFIYIFKGVTTSGQVINWQKEINIIR